MTVDWLTTGGAVLASLTVPGTVELLFLTVGGVLPARQRKRSKGRMVQLAVVAPAHNEELHIARAVQSLLAADRAGLTAEVVVVADNCTDHTADQARKAGARVLVRHNPEERGKGYALDFAFQQLLPEGFDGFVVVDADSEISTNLLTEMAAFIREGCEAAQCRYLVRNASGSPRTRLMKIALCAFNVLRPRGRDRWGLSAGIYGNGFMVTSSALRATPYSATSVVEDLEYHLALVRSGRRVHFADAAAVWGDMPTAGAGVKTQRTRWEGGRFRMLVEHAPGLAIEVLRGRGRLLEPLLDLLLLPLAFHVTLLLLALAVPSWPSRVAAMAGLGVVGAHLLGALRLAGGGWGDFAALAAAPFYVGWKILMLPRLIRSSRSATAWVRTERAKE